MSRPRPNDVCPDCGSAEYAFVNDDCRRCQACGTQYSSPPSVGFAIFMLLTGLPLLLIGVSAVAIVGGKGEPFGALTLIGLVAIPLVVGLFGGLLIRAGIRELWKASHPPRPGFPVILPHRPQPQSDAPNSSGDQNRA